MVGMRIHAILLTAVLVVSAAAVGTVGGIAPQSADGSGVQSDVQPVNQPVNNSSEEPKPVEPSQEELDKPVLLGSAPEELNNSNGNNGQGPTTASEGATRFFLTSGPDGYTLTEFTLRGVGDNIEVWVANNMSWPTDDPRPTPTVTDKQVDHLVSEFDSTIYPPETEAFGTPTPRDGNNSTLADQLDLPEDYYHTSADAGNKTALLVTNIKDENFYDPTYPVYTAGYFSPTVQSYTNRNVITVDSAYWEPLNETNQMVGIEGTFAHEYQHLIHADYDSDETSWINEGMSDFAEYLVGYGASEGHVNAYEQMPSNSLINWGDQGPLNILADYGEAYIFQMYLNDRYGTEFISALFKEEKNGIAGVRQTLDDRGKETDFYHLYQDFATAAVLDQYPSRFDWPFLDHTNVPNFPYATYEIDGIDLQLNTSRNVSTAGAWGTSYQTFDTDDPITNVEVSGTDYIGTQWNTTTDPVDGEGEVLYSGSGNLLDQFAVTRANITEQNSTLSFETYYNIEQNWDYGFVQVSTDGGETWQSLSNENTSSETADGAHPRVKANVPGFTGASDGWTKQTFDLSAYEGQEVLVAFRYTTDWASINPGWYLRNISVGDKTIEGDTAKPLMSLREATERPIEYQLTFIAIEEDGEYSVKQLDMRTFAESDEQAVEEFLVNADPKKVIVAGTWAANSGESGRVPVDVEISSFPEPWNNGNAAQHPGF